jgi:hypothetical protein
MTTLWRLDKSIPPLLLADMLPLRITSRHWCCSREPLPSHNSCRQEDTAHSCALLLSTSVLLLLGWRWLIAAAVAAASPAASCIWLQQLLALVGRLIQSIEVIEGSQAGVDHRLLLLSTGEELLDIRGAC